MNNSFDKLQNLMKHMRNSSASLMEFSTFGYMWTVTDSSMLVASHTIYTMLDKEPFSEIFTRESWKKNVHSKDLYKLIQAEDDLLNKGDVATADYRLITATGRHIYVQHDMYLSGLPDGRWKIMSIVQNITELKRADVILQAMNEGFFELDENFVIGKINDHTLKYWDLQLEKIVRKKLHHVFPQMEGTDFHNILLTARDEKINIASDVRDPVTGHWLHVSVAPYADGIIVTFYDRQPEKEAQKRSEEDRRLLEAAKVERAQFEAEQNYRAKLEEEVEKRTKELKETTHLISRVTDVMPDLLSVIELGTMKTNFINKNVLFEMGFDDLEKQTAEEKAELIHPDDKLVLKKYFDGFGIASDDDVIDVEYRARIKTGEWHWFHARGKVFARDEAGQATHCVNIVQNIDKRKGTEQQIERLNYNLLTKNEQLNSLNSELKQLNSITANNYTEALRHVYINLETIVTTDARNLSNSSRANLRRAQAAIQKMKLLSNDINNYLQLYDTRINKETIDPNLIMFDALDVLSRKIEESNAKINIDKLPSLEADHALFSKLMANLIDNAIKFYNENIAPEINIGYSLIDQVVDHKLVQNKPFIVISVSDNGIGFEKTESIFEPFTQLDHGKHKGAGMGLAICKKIMEMHGGFITGDSRPGEGATFNCYFPA